MPFPSRSHPDRQAKDPHQRAPGIITNVATQRGDPDRVNVFIDGQFAFGLSREIADQAFLVVGLDLDSATMTELLSQEDRHRALSIALAYLAHRPRAEGEIRSRLERAGCPDPNIEFVLDRLRDWRYVDDRDFARRWIENRDEHRPRGVRLLETELRQKGLPPTTIAEALEETAVDELAGAVRIARKRAQQLGALDRETRQRRLIGLLARRGYGYDVIRNALEAIEDETSGWPME